MNPRPLTRIALLAESKRLGSVRVRSRRGILRQLHQPNSRHLGVGQLRQEINALGPSTFHEYDLQAGARVIFSSSTSFGGEWTRGGCDNKKGDAKGCLKTTLGGTGKLGAHLTCQWTFYSIDIGIDLSIGASKDCSFCFNVETGSFEDFECEELKWGKLEFNACFGFTCITWQIL